ncbi:Glutamate--cysteine ligase [Armadillidium nasatum]|uniref:Glutamate--cysteine ligase n=1 Tax=Armadillidium nasatum TaxID=96803 RepID=A0A5N5T908_9CRUS|nr:Glutamate--cysteine ligase [Armadillidium nasatum]
MSFIKFKKHILFWQIEYIIVKLDHKKKKGRVSLRGSELLDILKEAEEKNPKEVKSLWRPEYAEYMVEGTPGQPYGNLIQHFNIVEHNMTFRRQELQSLLKEDEVALSITNFFRLGCPDFTSPPTIPTPTEGYSKSLFFPDEVITQSHPRFKTLTTNIRQRRGEKVAINVPKDFEALGDDGSSLKAALKNHVYMDAMGFGMGCCCLQMTFQTMSVGEARVLYDHLTPLCPIMLSLTAATPVFRGYLTDVDCRWDIISGSVDCRNAEERGLSPLKESKFVIPKSRYSSVDMYLSDCGARYNDTEVVYDEKIYQKLLENDIDDLLAKHIAHLFIRDSISLFSEKVHQDDEKELDHFEVILIDSISNSYNDSPKNLVYPHIFPPLHSGIGWRVEFRPCEVQITDFENAAFCVFIVLLTRAILTFKLNMLIPISKVDENMMKSQKRNAVLEEKFWFRKDIFSRDCEESLPFEKMTINEIINGKGDDFVGLVPLVKQYLVSLDCDADTACTIHQYLKLISLRATGSAMTTATWIRNFIMNHPEYNDEVSYDLLVAISEITNGKRPCPELLGITPNTKTSQDIPKAVQKFLSEKCSKGPSSLN